MHVLIAPDKFKDALDAAAVADAIAAGVRDALPAALITCCPLGDGGEGTGRLLANRRGYSEQVTHTSDALGRPVPALWWRSSDGGTAIIEVAQAAGLWRLQPPERDARRATSFGVGQLMQAALDRGARRLLLCAGGTATVEGGAGCVQALGWTLRDSAGHVLPPCTAADLPRVVRIEPPARIVRERPQHGAADREPAVRHTTDHAAAAREAAVPDVDACAFACEIVCDVDNPLLGPDGAARSFGPQKLPARHTSQDVEMLERGLCHWAELLARTLSRDVRSLKGGGAAGGLPATLAAALGATLIAGETLIARELLSLGNLDQFDLVLTGEGRLDPHTARGKVVGAVARLLRQYRAPLIALVGQVAPAAGESSDALARQLGLTRIVAISDEALPLPEQLAQTAQRLRQAACALVVGMQDEHER